MKAHLKTWQLIASAGAETWRALAKQAKSDPALEMRMQRVATALAEVEGYLRERAEKP